MPAGPNDNITTNRLRDPRPEEPFQSSLPSLSLFLSTHTSTRTTSTNTDSSTIQSTLQDITKALHGDISGLLTADDENYEVDDLHDEIIPLAKTLLTSKLGNRDA